MASYSTTQQVFSLSWLANINMFTLGSNAQMQSHAETAIKAVLADTSVQGLIGNWEVVWGPVVYTHGTGAIGATDNLLYVVRCLDTVGEPQYVVATSGTNTFSWFGWFVEDMSVSQTVPWPYSQDAAGARISNGTSIGLNILIGMQWNGQTLVEFLTGLTQQNAAVQITVAGLSLGGALSAALALALADTQGPGKVWAWDVSRRATVLAQPAAGATPGNGAFADHYGAVLPAGVTTRLWNYYDIVPHAWQEDMLAQIPNLYMPAIPPTPLIETMVLLAQINALGKNYQQILPDTPPLPNPGSFQAPPPDFSNPDLAATNKALLQSVQSILAGGKAAGKLGGASIAAMEQEVGNLLAGTATQVQNEDLQGTLKFLSEAGYQHACFYVNAVGINAFVRNMNQIAQFPIQLCS